MSFLVLHFCASVFGPELNQCWAESVGRRERLDKGWGALVQAGSGGLGLRAEESSVVGYCQNIDKVGSGKGGRRRCYGAEREMCGVEGNRCLFDSAFPPACRGHKLHTVSRIAAVIGAALVETVLVYLFSLFCPESATV